MKVLPAIDIGGIAAPAGKLGRYMMSLFEKVGSASHKLFAKCAC